MESATKERPVPPPPPRPVASKVAKPETATLSKVNFGELARNVGHRIGLYGPGGIGKTTLACLAPGPVALYDLDDSLGVLAGDLDGLDLHRVTNGEVGDPHTWQSMRDTLHAPGWDAIKTIVIDSATMAEELATMWTLQNVPHDKGGTVERLEDYGYGKGYQHVYETFLAILGDLDAHVRANRNIILVMHDCTANVPNPAGDDYIRYEPRLQSPGSGKASIRLRLREWLDHLLFLGYDIDVQKGKSQKTGKAKGGGSRRIFPVELPHCMAKSRTISEQIPLVKWDGTLWVKLLGVEPVPAEESPLPPTPRKKGGKKATSKKSVQ